MDVPTTTSLAAGTARRPSDRPRVLIAKPGMDSHWRGAIMVARALRDAGMEVIYLGNQTPEAIAQAALQEDADIIGLSCMSGSHLVYAPRVIELLSPQPGVNSIPVLVGGIIPDHDVSRLKKAGVAAVFRPGDRLNTIVEVVWRLARGRSQEPGDFSRPSTSPT